MTFFPLDLVRRRPVLLGIATVAAVACRGSAPTGSPSATDPPPHFTVENQSAPPVTTASVSFYAVVGQSREAALYYQPQGGEPGEDSVQLARIVVPAGALVTAPDGSPLAPGDSVLMTLSLVDTIHTFVQIDPSGLQFSPATPAELTISYQESDSTLTPQDVANLAIWSEDDSGNWSKLPSTVSIQNLHVRASVSALHARRSVYASAY